MHAIHPAAARRLAQRCITGALASCLVAGSAHAADPAGDPHCRPVGGTVMTNFISDTTTLGTATGDLPGAVSATILGEAFQGDKAVFTVQHHWVTDAGDTIVMDQATATTQALPPALFAVLSYPVTVTGGTGRFSGASGKLEFIGEVDFATGRTVFRYHGDVCVAPSSK